MKRFRNMLLVAGMDDGPVPEHIFDRALSLAKRNEAKLTLIDVVSSLEQLDPEARPQAMLDLILSRRRESLRRLVEAAREKGIEVETELAVGTPFLEITRRVQRFGHDLVITDGGRDEDAGGMDSTTTHLMRKCPSAIWVVRPTPGDRYARVLAAVDPDPRDPERNSLNRKIMELASSLAKLESSELHVVHAWEPPVIPVGASGEIWRQWERTTRTELKRRLFELLAKYSLGPNPQVHLVGGKPALAISRLAGEKQIDLLVMGTVCRTGIRGFFIGNTAEGVLRRVDCSLLTVKPEGFVSPV